jgi:hypothetical protein
MQVKSNGHAMLGDTWKYKGVEYELVDEINDCHGCSFDVGTGGGCGSAPMGCGTGAGGIWKPVNLNLTSNTKVNNMKNLKFQVETTTTYKLGKFKADSEEKLKIEVGNAIVVHLAKIIQQEDYDNEFMDALEKYHPDTFKKVLGIIADDLYEELQQKI